MESVEKNVLFIYLGVLMFLSFQVTDVSSATDTISIGQKVLRTDTIVSSSEAFILGFSYPVSGPGSGNSGFFIGIWYRESPQTIVWVANHENYVFQGRPSSDCYLKISNGNLVLYDFTSTDTIWSTGVKSSRSKDVRAVLLSNGNLVLRDGPNSSAVVLWQSFDHPSDTWLPGAKLNLGTPLLTSWNTLTGLSKARYTLEFDPNTNNSLIMVWNRSKTYWSSGSWDDRHKNFTGFQDADHRLKFELNLEKSYITYSSPLQFTLHLRLDVSGQLQLRFLGYTHDTWMVQWSQPADRCAVYRYCGSFQTCNETQNDQPCRCVPGFTQAIDERSGSTKLSNDCIRKNELQCGKGYNNSFLPIENMKLATDPTILVLTPNLVTTCASACLANCSCNAYAYKGNKCMMWTKDAYNLQQVYSSTGNTFFLRVAGPNIKPEPLNQGSGETKQRKGKRIVLPVVLSSLLASTAVLVGLYCFFSLRRSKRIQRDEKQREILGGIIDDDGEHMCHLNLHDIMTATNAFSEENKLGEGGFGPVYKGKLLNGTDVAIKRLSKKSSQGLTELKNEIVLIIKLQHKNLVRLLGYCVEGDEKLLIYEYMSNKSLDVLLFDSRKSRELDWETRMKIVNGTTKGLQYLHEDSRLKIIHRDLKVSNILLDDEMNPKISDFGTARIFNCKQIDDNTQRIVGTYGYMSPEYALGGIISEKSDIYSFGVLLLEIISGKKATRFMHNDQKHSLVAHAWESWCETKGVNIVDEALCGSYSVKEVMRCVHIALLCVQDHPYDRPTISQIVYMLSNDNDLPIPKQPTFSNVLNGNQQLVSPECVFSINEVTLTEMEAR